MKKQYKYLIFTIVLTLLINTFSLRTKADSGWDTSYDSGGSWSSSNDSWSSSSDSWSSSSDRDYSSSSDSSSSSRRNKKLSPEKKKIVDTIALSMLGATILITIWCIIKGIKDEIKRAKHNRVIKQNKERLDYSSYNDVNDKLLARYNIDKDSFKKTAYDKYVMIQNAWMNFDYDKLRTLLTDELYNSYIMQLDALKLKNQKNIMSDYTYLNAKIIDVDKQNDIINVKVYLKVEMYDYVVDSEEKVVRGDNKHKLIVEYVITFVKENNNTSETICPNCGSKVEATTSGKCEYCGAVIVVNAKDYVMSKKTCIGQRRK